MVFSSNARCSLMLMFEYSLHRPRLLQLGLAHFLANMPHVIHPTLTLSRIAICVALFFCLLSRVVILYVLPMCKKFQSIVITFFVPSTTICKHFQSIVITFFLFCLDHGHLLRAVALSFQVWRSCGPYLRFHAHRLVQSPHAWPSNKKWPCFPREQRFNRSVLFPCASMSPSSR